MLSQRNGGTRRRIILIGVMLVIAMLTPAAAQAQLQGGTRIGDADTPTAASIEIAQASVADGTAARVVLGRNDIFPDNLSGAAAAAGGALLLVDPAPAGLTADVAQEIGRLLSPEAPAECGTGLDAEVVLLGGPAALSTELEAQIAQSFCVARLFGPSRVETSVAVARALLDAGVTRDRLLVARDDNPADSAAAGAFAAATGTPIVVTNSNSLHPEVAALLDPAGGQWGEVILLGGTAALSDGVFNEIAAAAGPGAGVGRIAGATRDDTALQIALQLWGAAAGSSAAIVNGYAEDFWTYALPGGVASGASAAPLLYSQTDSVPDTTLSYLSERRPAVTTIGPPSRVSEGARAAAEAAATGQAPPPPAGDVRVIDLGTGGPYTVTTQPGDISITLVATAANGQDLVVLQGLTTPDGITISTDQLPSGGLSDVDIAVTYPFAPDQAFPVGDYTFDLATENGVGENVRAIIKAGDGAGAQVIDSNLFVYTNDPSIDEAGERDAAQQAIRATGSQILNPQNLQVGALDFIDTDADAIARFETYTAAVTNDDPTFRALCSDMNARSGGGRRLNVALIGTINSDGGGTIAGVSAGIPGVPLLADGQNSCVIVPITSIPIAQQTQTFWHEAGHFLGLNHTTEADGVTFDQIADTPQCAATADADGNGQVDEVECGAFGDNFIFWTGEATTMTAGQAFVLRRNPLFRPAA